MKKLLLIFVLMLAMAGFTMAQVIENFEPIPLNLMLGGTADSSTMTVVSNPFPSGINTSAYVCKYLRDKDGVSYGGFWSALPTPVDVTTNKYVHVKVWKTRITPLHFKLEGGEAGTLEIPSKYPQTVTNGWEDIVFDFSSKTGTYPTIAFMPDFEDPLALTEDITIYFDDIVVNNDSTSNSAAAYTIENFEPIPLNLMLGGASDASSMTVVNNPYTTNFSSSAYVCKYLRDKDGVSYGGFWSALPTPVDVTTNKYVHVKVWKPRISPLKFKLQGGAAGDLEITSKYPQTVVNGWQDIVFDFSSKTGTYPIISFMPDFEDPLTLTEDITIYFDDILVSSDSAAYVYDSVKFNVDMHGSGLTAGQPVYIAGDFGGIYGAWNGPGSNLNNLMTDANNDSIYSVSLLLPAGTYHYKYFIGAGWNGGEWDGDPNRTVIVNGDISTTVKWGVKPVNVTLNVDMHGSGLATGDIVYFAGNFGGSYGVWNEPGTNPANVLTDANADSIYTTTIIVDSIGTYEFKFFKNASWAGGEWDGGANRSITIVGDSTLDFLWGSPAGIHENQLASQVQVYPNPFSANLFINTTTEINQIIISNYIGQQVARFENLKSGSINVNTSDLKKGMYLVTFFAKDGSKYTQKLVKN